jgi:hypothetical protein
VRHQSIEKEFSRKIRKRNRASKKTLPRGKIGWHSRRSRIELEILRKQIEDQILDFYHVSAYLGVVAEVCHPDAPSKQKNG